MRTKSCRWTSADDWKSAHSWGGRNGGAVEREGDVRAGAGRIEVGSRESVIVDAFADPGQHRHRSAADRQEGIAEAGIGETCILQPGGHQHVGGIVDGISERANAAFGKTCQALRREVDVAAGLDDQIAGTGEIDDRRRADAARRRESDVAVGDDARRIRRGEVGAVEGEIDNIAAGVNLRRCVGHQEQGAIARARRRKDDTADHDARRRP